MLGAVPIAPTRCNNGRSRQAETKQQRRQASPNVAAMLAINWWLRRSRLRADQIDRGHMSLTLNCRQRPFYPHYQLIYSRTDLSLARADHLHIKD